MFFTVEGYQQDRYRHLLDQFYRLRKRVFYERLGWSVVVDGPHEKDRYDGLDPTYLFWTSDDGRTLIGGMRLMPTTGPTLLCDVFDRTFPDAARIAVPGVWEGTRMCVDDEALATHQTGVDSGRAFSLLLLALCECAAAHGIHTMLSNYEPHMTRLYRRAGAEVDELGRADGYGKRPVCCGAFEVSAEVLNNMRQALNVRSPLFQKHPEFASSEVGGKIAA